MTLRDLGLGLRLVNTHYYFRLYRPKSDFIANVTVKQVKFTDAKPDCNGENSALEKLEKMITEKFVKEQETMRESITALEKKLRRKQNENQNLIDNIEKLTKAELNRVSDIYDLKETLRKRDEECLRLSDELAVKTKEQLENIRVKDLEGELDDLRKVLKFTTDELWLLKEKVKVESSKTRRKHDIENNNSVDQNLVVEMKNMKALLDTQKEEMEELNEMIDKGDNIIKQKDKEIDKLKRALMSDQEKMTITEGEYSSLRCLMTEENETVHQIQEEMSRLLKIIANDQEAMVTKDKEIEELSKKNESFDKDLEKLKEQLQERTEELDNAKKCQEKQEAMVEMIESYKTKIKESMGIIEEKSKEIEKLNQGCRPKSLDAEKDKQIAKLNEQNSEMEKQISQNSLKSQDHATALNEINKQMIGLECELNLKEDLICQLKVILF